VETEASLVIIAWTQRQIGSCRGTKYEFRWTKWKVRRAGARELLGGPACRHGRPNSGASPHGEAAYSSPRCSRVSGETVGIARKNQYEPLLTSGFPYLYVSTPGLKPWATICRLAMRRGSQIPLASLARQIPICPSPPIRITHQSLIAGAIRQAKKWSRELLRSLLR